MSDNIIDFEAHKREHAEPLQSEDLSADNLMARLSSLPDDDLMASVSEAINDRMVRLLTLADIAAQVSKLLKSLGFDPDDFSVDEESMDRYLAQDEIPSKNRPWNGPFFDWVPDVPEDVMVRVVTTIWEDIDNPTEDGGVPIILQMDIYKLNEGDNRWQRYSDGEWVEDGPPADAFDFLEEFWESLDDDDWDDEDWDDEDEDDDDDWDEDDDDDDWDEDSILNLDLNSSTYGALAEAGIDTITRLREMSNDELLAIDGINRRSLFSIRRALKEMEDFGAE